VIDDAGLVRPFRRRVRHPFCGTLTVISAQAAEALALDPRALPDLQCAGCRREFPAGDYRWISDDGTEAEPVGFMPPPDPQPEPEARMTGTESPSWCGHGHGCHAHIFTELAQIRALLATVISNERTIMTEQSQLDATATSIETDVTAISAGVTAVQSEIAALQAANPALDFTGVNAALADLSRFPRPRRPLTAAPPRAPDPLMAEPWKCPECGSWLAPTVSEHRCDGDQGSAGATVTPILPTGGGSAGTAPITWTGTTVYGGTSQLGMQMYAAFRRGLTDEQRARLDPRLRVTG
jgi:hypothetical protein